MTTIISLINLKGGVGKSTLTFNLGGVFAKAGCRTLLIDADPQGNLSSGIFGPACIEKLAESETLAALFSDRPPRITQLIRPTNFENLGLIPSNELLGRYNIPVDMAGSSVAALRNVMPEVEEQFDVILIDNAPSLNAVSWASLLASQHVMVPTIPEDYSSQGLAQVGRCVTAAQQRNRELGILGFVLTMVQPRLTIHRAYEVKLREHYGEVVFETFIKAEKLHKEAIMERLPLCFYKPRSAAAKVYEALAEEVGLRVHQQRESMEAA